MRNLIVGLIVGAACVIVAFGAYFIFGFAPVATSSAPMPMEHFLAQAALRSARARAGSVQSPIQPTEANLLAGARNYRASCAVCHSLPGVGKTDIAKGMYPGPPLLLAGEGVTDDPVGATHWVIQQGIRMTGMPSFAGSYSDEELWQMALLLSRANDLPPSVQELLRRPDSVQVQSTRGEASREESEDRR